MAAEQARPGAEFSFPFSAYSVQVEFMQQLTQVLDEGKVGIFESPTGTVRMR